MRQSTATSSVVCCHSQLCNMKTTTRPLPVVVTTETTTKSTTETKTQPLPVVVTTETTTERTTATSLAAKKKTQLSFLGPGITNIDLHVYMMYTYKYQTHKV